jgi:predicted ferric reductase
VSLVLGNLVTILVMMFYGFDTENWMNWEDIGYRAGFMSICQLPLVILLAGKQSIIGLLTGTSYDYLNWYHRWVSRTLWLSATIHMGFWFRDYGKYNYILTMIKTDYFTQHGFAAWCVLTFIFLTSFAPVRRWNYEFFVIQHIVTMAGFLAAVYLHSPIEVRFWVWIPIGFVCFDRFIRLLVLAFANLSIVHFWSKKQRPFFANKATFTPLPGNVTLISIPDPLITWNPGQHVFLGCHAIAPLQSHPFTIMSIPSDNKLEFLVRAEKGGTRRFFRFATKHNVLLGETQSSEKSRRTVFIEGPYGAVRPLRQFDSIVLFAGGMGCTYTLPLMRDIVQAWKLEGQSAGTLASRIPSMAPMRLATTKRIRFVWVIKSRSQLSWLESELTSVLQDLQKLRHQFPEIDKDIEVSIYLTCDEALEKPTVAQNSSAIANEEAFRNIEQYNDVDGKKAVQTENVVVRSASSSSGSTDEIQATGRGVKKTCCCSTVIEDEDDISSMPKCTCSGPAATSTAAATEKEKETALSSSTSSLANLKGFKTLAGRPHPRTIIGNVLERAEGESAVVVCGPRGLAADVRHSVVSLSDERAVHKGTEAQGIYFHIENFGW